MKKSSLFLAPVMCLSMLFSCGENTDTTTATEAAPISEPATTTEIPAEETTVNAQEAPAEESETPGENEIHELVAQNLTYSPAELRVQPGQRIQVNLINKGDVPYSLKFELPGGNQELREPVQPGRKAALVFTAPKKEGTYTFYSPLPNQRGRGMTGTLVVE